MANPSSPISEWSEIEEQFFQMWSERPCLYDHTDENYNNRDVKKNEIDAISEALNISVEEVQKKFRSYRTTIMKLMKQKQSSKRITTKRQDQLIEALNFLVIAVQKSKEVPSSKNDGNISNDSNLDDKISEGDSVEIPATKRPLPQTIFQPKKRKEQVREPETVSEVYRLPNIQPVKPGSTQSNEGPLDEEAIFANFIAAELRLLSDKRTKVIVKNNIHNAILQGQLDNLDATSSRPQRRSGQNQAEYTIKLE